MPLGSRRVVRIKRNPTWAEGGKVVQQPELLDKFLQELGPEEAEVAYQAMFLRLLVEGERVEMSTAVTAAYRVREAWEQLHEQEWVNAVKWGVHYLLEDVVEHVKMMGQEYADLLRTKAPAMEDRLVGAGLVRKTDRDRSGAPPQRPIVTAPPPSSRPTTPERGTQRTEVPFNFTAT